MKKFGLGRNILKRLLAEVTSRFNKTDYNGSAKHIVQKQFLRFSILIPKEIILSFLVFPLLFISCATAPTIQPQVNSLVVAERFDRALKIFDTQKKGYGRNNEFLYLVDKGLVLHLAGRYPDSTVIFDQAKLKYDQLYTQSLTKIAGSWAWNDYARPYRGEDFERVMINIFQALNYIAIGNLEEALVEARDVDSKLSAINARYNIDQKNVYREDAFARFLAGVLYEASGTRADLNDAFISYQKAIKSYENDYRSHYGTETPILLKENMLSVAKFMGGAEFNKYRNKFKGVPYYSLEEKSKKGEVYLIHYHGLSPIKHQESLVIPLPEGFFARVAFPRYSKRFFTDDPQYFVAEKRNTVYARQVTELGQDIEKIAIKNLNDRKVRTIVKSAVRSAGKYLFEREQEKNIGKKYGEETVRWFRYGSSLFNVYSEQADLRSWQTLPAQIRIARLILDPGEYELTLDEVKIGPVTLKAGEKKFLIVRTSK